MRRYDACVHRLAGISWTIDFQGLPGCEEIAAYCLAQRGLGDSLLFATQALGPTELQGFLTVWRYALREELTREGYMTTATQVSDAFPNIDVLNLYVHPITSWSCNGPSVDTSGWVMHMPDIVSISRLCEELFSWGTAAELPDKLFTALLPGLCLKRLAQVNNNIQDADEAYFDSCC